MQKDAIISDCGRYRYALWRIWDPQQSQVLFICLNPSIADEHRDDPTLRRCVAFARRWHFGGLAMANLFALRATDPAALKRHGDPVGPDNDRSIQDLIAASECVVVAWGNKGQLMGRDRAVLAMLDIPIYCLGRTKQGHPRHPLYVKRDVGRERMVTAHCHRIY